MPQALAKNYLLYITVCLLLFVTSTIVHAYSLVDIYAMAKQSDTDIQIAESTYFAEAQARPIARANILPQANISANTTGVRQKIDGSTFNIEGETTNFNDHGYTINLTQALYHHDFYVQLRQAKNSVARAKVDLDSAYQDLMIRTSEAYFNVLSEQDTLSYQQSEKEAIGRQLEQAKKRFEVGVIAITDVKETQASYDLAVANEIDAKVAVERAKDELEVIIAQRVDTLNPLSERMELVLPEPNDVEDWVYKALEQNLNLLSSEYTTKIAQQEIKLRQSRNLPTLDIVASHRDTETGGISGSREVEESQIGLELNIPIVEGGRTYYRTKEARYSAEVAQNEYEKVRRVTVQSTRDAYLNVIAGISRVKALVQALESTEAAARAAEAGFQVGTRTSVDVLLALRETFLANRDYSRARYDYLLSSLRLKQATGVLSIDDLLQIDVWLN